MTCSSQRPIVAASVLRGSAAALVIKFTASMLGFVMFALASRNMGPEAFGSLAVIFNAMSFLAVVALWGQETLIIRSWSEYCGSDRPGLARGALSFGALVVAGSGLVTAVIVAVVWRMWDPTVSAALLIAACSFLFAHSLLQFSGQFARVAAGIVLGDAPRESMWRFIVVAVLAGHYMVETGFGAPEFFFVATAAIVVAIVFQAWQVARLVPQAVRQAQPQHDIRAWFLRALKMWLAAILDTTGQYLEVVVIGAFLGPTVAGFYFVATRITNGFAMISASISSYAQAQISALFYSGAKADLQTMLRSLAIICAGLVGLGLLLIVVAGRLLLSAFGADYASAYAALLVLAAGGAVVALAGPAAHVLLLTGHEGAYPRIMLCGMVLRFALIAVLGPTFGLMGAAIAWAVSAVAIALALIVASCRLVGVDPSLRSVFARPPRIDSHGERWPLMTHAPTLDLVARAPTSASRTPAKVRKARIVLLQTQAEAAGAQEVSRILGEGLAGRGYEVQHVFLFRRTAAFDRQPNTFFCMAERPTGIWSLLQLLVVLVGYLRTARPAALICFQHYGNLVGSLAGRLAGIDAIITNRTTARSLVPWWVQRLDRILGTLGMFEKMVVTKTVEEEYQDFPPAYRARVVRIDHGFASKSTDLSRDAARTYLGLPANATLLGSVARLHPDKNLAAAIRLLPLDPGWHLAFAGQGSDCERLAGLAQSLGVAERVHFLGELAPDEISIFLRALDVFVFPTLAEMFPIAVIEAAEAGVPVVANGIKPVREVLEVEGMPCALFVDAGNTASFAAAVQELLSDRDLRGQLAARGRRLSQVYSLDAMVDRFAALIDGLMPVAGDVRP
jgi:L-malate glycosyltransferase